MKNNKIEPSDRYEELDALRGIAALFVFFFIVYSSPICGVRFLCSVLLELTYFL